MPEVVYRLLQSQEGGRVHAVSMPGIIFLESRVGCCVSVRLCFAWSGCSAERQERVVCLRGTREMGNTGHEQLESSHKG